MIVFLNGHQTTLVPGAGMIDILAILGFESPRGLAVAVDGNVVPRSNWAEFKIEAGMHFEVLRAVQGG